MSKSEIIDVLSEPSGQNSSSLFCENTDFLKYNYNRDIRFRNVDVNIHEDPISSKWILGTPIVDYKGNLFQFGNEIVNLLQSHYGNAVYTTDYVSGNGMMIFVFTEWENYLVTLMVIQDHPTPDSNVLTSYFSINIIPQPPKLSK